MKILLAVDGSRSSLDAVANLVEHVSWFKDAPQVELITVRPPVPKLPRMGMVVSKAQIERYYQEEGATCLAAAKKKLEAAKLKYRAEVLVGPIAETIVAHGKRVKADVIFIGTRGMTATANALLGSVATKILNISSIPVLVVK